MASSSDDSDWPLDSEDEEVGLKGVTLSDSDCDSDVRLSSEEEEEGSSEDLMDSDDDPFISLAPTQNDGIRVEEEFQGEYCVKTIWDSEEDEDSEDSQKNISDEEDKIKPIFEQKKTKNDKKENKKIKDDRLSGMVKRLVTECKCSPEVASEASKRCKTFDEAVKYTQQLIAKNEFLKMELNESEAAIALELWSKNMVEQKEEAAKWAKKSISFEQAVKMLKQEKEKLKKLRKVMGEHDFSSSSEAEKLCELLELGYSEAESVRAIKQNGTKLAENFIEQYREQKQKRIRKLMGAHDLSMEQSLVAVDLMDMDKCDEKMASYLAKDLEGKEAREEWKNVQKKIRKLNLLRFYEMVSTSLKTGKQVRLALDLAEMGFDHVEIVEVADNCDSVAGAMAMWAKRECTICGESYTHKNMVTLICGHELCVGCSKGHFTSRIRDHSSVTAIVCPFDNCQCTNIDDYDYFNFLEQLLKNLVDEDVYIIFQNKLRDRAIASENIIWCPKCQNAFMLGPYLDKVNCPECQHPLCAKCKTDWEPNHEGKTCAQVRDLETDRTSEEVIDDVLRLNGIECPECKTRFALVQGGCMHFTCTNCQFEFCEGCARKMFKRGEECGTCSQNGLHAHHPRYCQYYLRDYDIQVLENLFTTSHKEVPACPLQGADEKCQVVVQRLEEENTEEKCGNPVTEGQPALCERHYKEHLCTHIVTLQLEPASCMLVAHLEQELKRHRQEVPLKEPEEGEGAYRTRLVQCVLEKVPYGSVY